MKNEISTIIITVLFAFELLGQSRNVSKTGTTAAAFLEISVGASATGMGGAFVSIANDASALHWNPGGIARLDKYEAMVLHANWIAETKFDFAGLVLPLGNFGTLGFSFKSLSMDDMKVRTVEMPEGTGEYFSAGDISVGVSYARNLTDRFAVGFSAKYIQQKIWHMTAQAFAFDAGTIFRTDLPGNLTIGAAMTNFGTTMKLSGRDTRYFIRIDQTKFGSNDRIPTNIELEEWELPLTFQIGVSAVPLDIDDYKIQIAVDALHPNNDYESVNFGMQFSYHEYVFIRGGYQSAFLSENEGGLTFGFGVNSKMLLSESFVSFDYAYRDFGRLQNVHFFSVGIEF